MLSAVGGDLFSCGSGYMCSYAGLCYHWLMGLGHIENGYRGVSNVAEVSALRCTELNPVLVDSTVPPPQTRSCTYGSEDMDVLVAGDQVGVLSGACGCFKFISR